MHELVYTSASKGLRSNSAGYTIVAQSAGIPNELVDSLEQLSQYKHREVGAKNPRVNPIIHAHQIVSVGTQRYHVLSRIQDAGLDYSGRGNFLAHHIALSDNPPSAGPAVCLGAPDLFYERWDDAPRTLEPRGRLRVSDVDTKPCRLWERATGDAGWGGVLAAAVDPSRPALVVYEPGQDVLPLIAESLSLLPPDERWQVSFTTLFLAVMPGIRCQWRFVPSDAASLPKLLADHRVVIRLDESPSTEPDGLLVQAARSGTRPVSRVMAPSPAAYSPPSGGYGYEAAESPYPLLPKAAGRRRGAESPRPGHRSAKHSPDSPGLVVLPDDPEQTSAESATESTAMTNLLIGVALGGLAMAVILLGIEFTSPNGYGLIGMVTGKENKLEAAEKAIKEKDEKIEAGERAISEKENKLKAEQTAKGELESKLKLEQAARELAEKTAKEKADKDTKDFDDKLKKAVENATKELNDKLAARDKRENKAKTDNDQQKRDGRTSGQDSEAVNEKKISIVYAKATANKSECNYEFDKTIVEIVKIYPADETIKNFSKDQGLNVTIPSDRGTVGKVFVEGKSLTLRPGTEMGSLYRIRVGLLCVKLDGGELKYVAFTDETPPDVIQVNCNNPQLENKGLDTDKIKWVWTPMMSGIKNISAHKNELNYMYYNKNDWTNRGKLLISADNPAAKWLYFSRELTVKIRHIKMNTPEKEYTLRREETVKGKISTQYSSPELGKYTVHFLFTGDNVFVYMNVVDDQVDINQLRAEILKGQLICPVKVENEIIELPIATISSNSSNDNKGKAPIGHGDPQPVTKPTGTGQPGSGHTEPMNKFSPATAPQK